jgi:hypothetical protein
MPRIISSPRASQFIAARGGEVFAWSDRAGIQRTSLDRPDSRAFEEIPADGFTLWIDEAIPEALVWKIELSLFPRPRIAAHWNATTPAGQLGSGISFWSTLLRRAR